MSQKMAPLPIDRLVFTFPFAATGIVSDLTTKTFFGAFDRFTNRRDQPNSIRSDNGTTFVEAKREIAELFQKRSPVLKEVRTFAENLGITWTFSQLYGLHFGGIWEAAVKSFKFHYKRVLGETPLTFEEHSTLATQKEGCLNSRPMCTIRPYSRDQIPLTPEHFLIGQPIRVLPPISDVSDPTKSYSKRFTLLLVMRNSFWKTSYKEVLHQIQ